MKDSGTDSGGGGYKSPGIYCGDDAADDAVYCTGTNFCCARGFGETRSFTCTAPGVAACAGGLNIKCDDRTDCPSGQLCCATFDNNIGYRDVQCKATCTASPGTTAVRFCDPNAPTDECTSEGKACTPSGSLDGFSYCKAP